MKSRVLEASILHFIQLFVILAVVAVMTPSAKSQSLFDHVVVFGDSLSDNGNAGRFSNGPVWVEYLSSRFGLTLKSSRMGGSNFAVGGALLDPGSGPTSLRAQANAYLQGPRPQGRILYIVYGGGNDLLAAVGQPQTSATVEGAVASVRSIVADLAQVGATDILVPNLPPLGITPAVRSQGPRAIEAANKLAEQFNGTLDRTLTDLRAPAGLRLHRLDVWQLAERVRSDPAAAGFIDVTNPCGQRCDRHLFWDSVHPTTRAHERLAEAALQVLISR
jgi:outer membrane lipase/esterase